MAYEISYSPQENHRYPIFRPRKKLSKWLLGVVLAAVTAFVEDVRQGVSIPDAFQTFCREIVKDVEVPKNAD